MKVAHTVTPGGNIEKERSILISINIRYANENDAEILGQIHSQSLISAFNGIFSDEYIENTFSYDRRKKGFEKELALGNPETAIIYNNEEPVGLVTFGKSRYSNVDDLCIEIWRIYIKPSSFRMGFGAELMKWCFKELKYKGYKQAIIWVLEDNQRARNFYEKMGFINDGIEQIIEKEVKELRYSRKIEVIKGPTSCRPPSK